MDELSFEFYVYNYIMPGTWRKILHFMIFSCPPAFFKKRGYNVWNVLVVYSKNFKLKVSPSVKRKTLDSISIVKDLVYVWKWKNEKFKLSCVKNFNLKEEESLEK